MRSSLKEALERRERDRSEDTDHRPSGIPVELVLQASIPIEQPISLVRALMDFGLDLPDAHDTVDRLASGERISVTLHLTPRGSSPFALSRFGVAASAPQPVEASTIPGDVLGAFDAWRLSRSGQAGRKPSISSSVEGSQPRSGATRTLPTAPHPCMRTPRPRDTLGGRGAPGRG